MNGLRAALRLAWRDALNSRPRSALIIAMIALPVAAFTALPLIAGTTMLAGTGPEGTAVNALVIAMVVLETVLLAGPAFAVGLRRQRRLLALVSAAGGSPGQLRAVVLCAGLLLGGVAGLTGTAFGFLLGWAARALLAEHPPRGRELPPWDTPWLWVAAIVVTAVLSGLAAAYAPARQAARTDATEILAGRRSAPSPRRGLPILGGILIVSGVAVIPLSIGDLREFGAAAGATLLIIGFVLVTPAVIALTARFAERLPLPLRLAVRDADRNRVRTAPAIAAIMAVTAALTALSIGAASDFEQRRVEYAPRLQAGQTSVQSLESEERAQRVEAAVRRVLPDHRTARVEYVPSDTPDFSEASGTYGDYGEGAFLWMRCGEESCDLSRTARGPQGDNQVITDSEGARLLLKHDDPSITAALDEGKAVVFVPNAVKDGQVEFTVDEHTRTQSRERNVRMPAVQARLAPGAPGVLIPPKALQDLKVRTRPFALVVDAPLGEEKERLLKAEIERISADFEVYTERGFNEPFPLPLLVLGAAASVLVLAGALIATGLAAADSRPDLVTLTAVGARPVTRRLLLLAQTGYIALLGCALGLLAGVVPGLAVTRPLTDTLEEGTTPHGVIIDIPWLLLLTVLVGVPLLASAVTALSVRGEQVLPERAAT